MPSDEMKKKDQLSEEEVDSLRKLLPLTQIARHDIPAAPATIANADREEDVLDLVDLFWFIVYKLKYVVLVALLGALLGGVYGIYFMKPVYSSTAKLYILGQSKTAIEITNLQIGSMLTMDYQEVFKTWEVHENVRKALGLDYSYSEMQRMLTVTNPTNTRVLYITVTNTDPQLATDMANMYTTAAREFILRTMDAEAPNEFSVALKPSVAVSRGKIFYVVLGFAVGILLVLIVLVCIYLLDDRPKTAEDIQKATGMTTLAVIPVINKESLKAQRRAAKR